VRYLFALLAIFALTASAADISGSWKGTADAGNGPIERTFVFKVSGNTLTGETTSEMLGKSTITDGKVDGNNLSFTIKANFQGNDVVLTYKGTVSGDTMKLTSQFPDGPTIEWAVKKTS
jgi:hypothetical protein